MGMMFSPGRNQNVRCNPFFFILMNINQFSFRCLYENLLDLYMVSGAHVQKNVEAVNSIET